MNVYIKFNADAHYAHEHVNTHTYIHALHACTGIYCRCTFSISISITCTCSCWYNRKQINNLQAHAVNKAYW